jgi:hypothetical protein
MLPPALGCVWALGGNMRQVHCSVHFVYFAIFGYMAVSIGINSVIFSRSAVKRYRPQNANLVQNSPSQKPSGLLTDKTKTKLKNLLSNWLSAETSLSKAYFLTLTFPPQLQHITDIEAKRKYLNRFLIWLGRCGVSHWFWVAERGGWGLHFHLIFGCDTEGVVRDGRHEWRRITGTAAASAAHIRPVRSWRKLVGYVTKGTQNAIEGRLWGCSAAVRAFQNIRLTEKEERRFAERFEADLEHVFTFDFGVCYRPVRSCRKYIERRFRAIWRRQKGFPLRL